MTGAPCYRADAPAMRLSVVAEGMSLVYHRPSGITHVLLPPAPEILAVLAEGPADAATIAGRLARDYGLDDADDPIADIVTARLDELAAAGLVARA